LNEQDYEQLTKDIEVIVEMAKANGLDFYPVHFEVVPASIMYEFGAYGIPGRFSHWTHGKAYNKMKMQYDFGLSIIYEMVINTNPAYAFLLENNSLTANRLVAAHVLGHVDFFKNNIYFQRTNRHMIETASLNAERIRQYEYQHGSKKVEEFLDAVLSISEHIDPHQSFATAGEESEGNRREQVKPHVAESAYDDLWSLPGLPTEAEAAQQAALPLKSEKEKEKEKKESERRRFPAQPEKDLLLFLQQHARHLEDWQRDVIGIVHQEMLYFVPQMQTKIMNEGWAAYHHQSIMREFEMSSDDYTEYAKVNAGVMHHSRFQLNPYYLGLKLYESIERRWDAPTEEERDRLKRVPGQGRAKIFEVREMDNDVSFLRNYLTKELIAELDLYLYAKQGNEWVIVEKNWEKVRDGIVASMTNFGQPYITVDDGDYNRNHELYLRHHYEGQELDASYAEKVLQYIHQLWGRPVHLETVVGDERILLSHDGSRAQRVSLGPNKVGR